jgi:serine protein kinase
VYNGENLKDKAIDLKSAYELKDRASLAEGMNGLSTRFAYKVLSKTFNFDPEETAANPVHLINIITSQIKKQNYDNETKTLYMNIIQYEAEEYRKFLEREIKKAYLESYDDYGQNIFDRYVTYAELWLEDEDYRNPDTNELIPAERLEDYLSEIEIPSGLGGAKEFRNEVVKFCYKYRAKHGGKNPSWSSYSKMREVIEKKIFANTDELLPIISFSTKASRKEEKKHEEFVSRMMKNGYTKKQVKLLCDWYIHRAKK